MADITTANNYIEPAIDNLIASMFPSFYEEEGQVFIEFVKEYFSWLETTGQAVYYARGHIQNKDVDLTIDQFLLHFKKKFTPNVIYNTHSDVQDMVKQSLPFYRSKGTDLSFTLFFNLVYGSPATVFHPGDYVFSLSSGDYHKDVYLEISPAETNSQFLGQEIVGVTSGAIAFVDRIIRRIINGRIVDVMYISAISGLFQFGELISLNV
jgi:hypothetical protein